MSRVSIDKISSNVFKDKGARSVSVMSGITELGIRAFFSAQSLEEVFLPNTIKSIGRECFADCVNLASIDIPDSVTIISDNAFSGCKSLTSVFIPSSVQEIGEDIFSDCGQGLRVITSYMSVAHKYCEKNGIKTQLLDAPTFNTRFFDETGSVIYSEEVEYGQNVSNVPSVNPVQTGSIPRSFVGWDNSTIYITKDTDFYPIITSKEICTVTFYNNDGSIYKVLKTIRGGSLTEQRLENYSIGDTQYLFSGWDKTVNPVNEDKSVYPVFETFEGDSGKLDDYFGWKYYYNSSKNAETLLIIDVSKNHNFPIYENEQDMPFYKYKDRIKEIVVEQVNKDKIITPFIMYKFMQDANLWNTAKEHFLIKEFIGEGVYEHLDNDICIIDGYGKVYNYATKEDLPHYKVMQHIVAFKVGYVIISDIVKQSFDEKPWTYTSVEVIGENLMMTTLKQDNEDVVTTISKISKENPSSTTFLYKAKEDVPLYALIGKDGDEDIFDSVVIEDEIECDTSSLECFAMIDREKIIDKENVCSNISSKTATISYNLGTNEINIKGTEVSDNLLNNAKFIYFKKVAEKITISMSKGLKSNLLTNIPCVTEIVLDNIPEIPKGIFKHATNLKSVTVPYIGRTRNLAYMSTGCNESTMGYFFECYDEETAGCVKQPFIVDAVKPFEWFESFEKSFDSNYCVWSKFPENLQSITVTNARIIPFGAFSSIHSLKYLSINDECERIYGFALFDTPIEELHLPFVGKAPFDKKAELYTYDVHLGYIFGYKRNQQVYDPDSDPDYGWVTPYSEQIKMHPSLNIPSPLSRTLPYTKIVSSISGTNAFYYISKRLKIVETHDKVIQHGAFVNCDMINEVIAKDVIEVGAHAFRNCVLAKAQMSPKTIMWRAFYNGLNGGMSVELLAKAKNIGAEAFQKCYPSIRIPHDTFNNFDEIASERECSFTDDTIRKSEIPLKFLKSLCSIITISPYKPSPITEIGSWISGKDIFENWIGGANSFGNIDCNVEVDGVEYLIHDNCVLRICVPEDISVVNIPEGIEYIGSNPFTQPCSHIKKVCFPTSLKGFLDINTDSNLEELVFSNADAIKNFPISVGYSGGLTNCNSWFSGNITILDNENYLNDARLCSRLSWLFPQKRQDLTSKIEKEFIIDYDERYVSSWKEQEGQTKITIPESVLYIQSGLFKNASKNIVEMEIDGDIHGLHSIPQGVKNLDIPPTIKWISTSHYSEIQYNLERISIGEGCKKIEYLNMPSSCDPIVEVPDGCYINDMNIFSPIKIRGGSEDRPVVLGLYRSGGFHSGIAESGAIPENIAVYIDNKTVDRKRSLQYVDATFPKDKLKRIKLFNDTYTITNNFSAGLPSLKHIDFIDHNFNPSENSLVVAGFGVLQSTPLTSFNDINSDNIRWFGCFVCDHGSKIIDIESLDIKEMVNSIGENPVSIRWDNLPTYASYFNFSSHPWYDFGNSSYYKTINVDSRNQDFKAVHNLGAKEDAPTDTLLTRDGKRLITIARGTASNLRVVDSDDTKYKTTYVIPEGVEILDELSLGAKNNISNIHIPNSFIIREEEMKYSINPIFNTLTGAMYFDTLVENYTVNNDNPNYISDDGILYSKDGTELWAVPVVKCGKAGNDYALTIRKGTKKIMHGSMCYHSAPDSNYVVNTNRCFKFAKIYLPMSIEYIDIKKPKGIGALRESNVSTGASVLEQLNKYMKSGLEVMFYDDNGKYTENDFYEIYQPDGQTYYQIRAK